MAFEALRRDVEREDFALAPTAHSRLRTGENGKPSKLHLSLHVHMPVLNFHIRAAQKFWLDYSIGALALHGDGTLSGQELVQAQSTLNLRSQTVDFIAVNDPRLQGESAPFGGESIHFPAILASVSYGEGAVRSLVTLERIAVTVTAGILDSVFTVQKRFEHDIDELLTVFAKHKGKRKHQDEQDETPLPRKLTALKCSAQLILRGLNLGLKGPQSTQYIGADLIDGYISHNPAAEQAETHWEAHVSNLALSLAQDVTSQAAQSPVPTEKTTVFDRSYRLAYFVLDVHAGNRVTEVEELKELTRRELQGESQTSHLHIKVAKVHAVMQTAAIEALDGLLEHCKISDSACTHESRR